ncbi:unnamed protein product [Paramecium sonneborni]|uniref:Phosphatidic acid phosphatase type 2/haloperoxidase domain-containing protein n=1 Tax=Paramecium sonneborni TaxID=65129 RepID=A0A8S1LT52_9CILI|nr:unnamed protein product [Paramecium sonneborni]
MKIFIVTTLILICYLLLDQVYDQYLWDLNTIITKYLQTYQDPFYEIMFNCFSDWINLLPQIAFLIFIFTENKLAYIIYVCLIQSITSINSVLKNLYHQPRPYWIESEIQALSCNKDFGKPSGHTMASLTTFALFPLIVLPQNFKKKHRPIQIIVIGIMSIWTVMAALSRIYLGMHSIGQILLGWVYTGYFIIIYISYLHKPILNYLKKRLSSVEKGISWKFVAITGLTTFIYLIISILLYYWNKNYVYYDQTELNLWLSIIQQKCSNQTHLLELSDSKVFYNFCLYKSFEITLIFFIILGIKISNGKYDEEYFIHNYSLLNQKQKLMRILIVLILLFPLKILEMNENDNVWLIIIIQTIPWNAFCGLSLTFGYSKLLKYYKLNIEGDFLYIKQDPQTIYGKYKEIKICV